MKLDPDLSRTILLKIEADPSFTGWPQTRNTDAVRLGIAGYSDEDVTYNLVQLVDGGLLVGNTKMASQTGNVMIAKLTPSGHQFLDDIRDSDIWKRTRERAKGAASIGFGFLWEIVKAEIKLKLGLP